MNPRRSYTDGAQYVASVANDLRKRAHVDGPPIDVDGVALSLGLAVRLVEGPASFSGRLIPSRLIIEVNKNHHLHRQRFTVGHELGHYQLRHSGVVCVNDARSSADPTGANERQANQFAAELLMPADLVRALWDETVGYQALARRFEVSDEAMWYRLEDLNLLGL